MNISEANRLLGGPHGSEEQIRAAFTKAVRGAHPDTAEGYDGTGVEIAQLQAARDTLLAGLNQGQEIPCKMCGGSGRVGTGFGSTCTACRGEGITIG